MLLLGSNIWDLLSFYELIVHTYAKQDKMLEYIERQSRLNILFLKIPLKTCYNCGKGIVTLAVNVGKNSKILSQEWERISKIMSQYELQIQNLNMDSRFKLQIWTTDSILLSQWIFIQKADWINCPDSNLLS